jgi:hypothetical protein
MDDWTMGDCRLADCPLRLAVAIANPQSDDNRIRNRQPQIDGPHRIGLIED